MKRLMQVVVATIVLTLSLTIPAQAGQPRTVIWHCDVPDVGPVDFVIAAEPARHGITTANAHAGPVFLAKFGDDCSVL